MTIEEAKEEYSSSVTGDAYVAEVYGGYAEMYGDLNRAAEVAQAAALIIPPPAPAPSPAEPTWPISPPP